MSFLFDHSRGTREKGLGESSEMLMKEFMMNHSENPFLRMGLFFNVKTPRFLTGAGKEIFGVQHMKLHVFDDNVMITGANMSSDYYTN